MLQGVRRSGGAPALAQTLAALREEVRLPFRELLGLCCCNACCGTRGRVARRRCWIDSLYAGGLKTRLVINKLLSLQHISVLRHGSSTTADCRAKVPQKLDPTADMLLQNDTWDADAHRWAGLESLAKIMCIELLELRRERDRAVASRTVAGHATNLLGYCLSVFCIARSA